MLNISKLTKLIKIIIYISNMDIIHDIQYNYLEKQEAIINALFKYPSGLAEYMHYRGDPIKFNDASVPNAPLIPHNDHLCCILNKIANINDKCSNIDIKPLGPQGKIGVPYIITQDGIEIIVKLSSVSNPYSEYMSKPPTSLAKIKNIESCITTINLNNIRYIASDEFTNETLIAYILNYVAAKKNLPPLFVKHYQGIVCNDKGLNFMEYCNLGPLDKITIKINSLTILQIFTQITVALHMLHNYTVFISGDLKSGNVFLKSDAILTEYKGIILNAPFTCKIADYGKSSCMLQRKNNISLRFFTQSHLANLYLKIDPFEPDIEKGKYYYIEKLLNIQLYTRIFYQGAPYYKTFDLYTVIVSTLTNKEFYYTFFADKKLTSIFWDTIWKTKEDAEDMRYKIYQYMLEGTGHSINDAINMLKGIPLKCGAVKNIMDAIIKYQ